MKYFLSFALAFAGVIGVTTALSAHDEHGTPVSLNGTIICAKCGLKESKTCQTVIQVKGKTATITYYFADRGAKEQYHEPVCGGEKFPGTVTGVVADKNGKKYIAPTKVEYAKK